MIYESKGSSSNIIKVQLLAGMGAFLQYSTTSTILKGDYGCYVQFGSDRRWKVGQTSPLKAVRHTTQTSPHCKRSRPLRSLGVCALQRPADASEAAPVSSLSGGPTELGSGSSRGSGNMSVSS